MKFFYKILHAFIGHKKEDCTLTYGKDGILDHIKCNKCGVEMGHSDFIL